MPTSPLKSPRIKLRQWRTQDKAAFAELNADSEVMRYFPSVLNSTESSDLADRFAALIDNNGWGFWAAELVSTTDFIGFIGLHRTEEGLPFAPCVEVGWRLARRYWGHGFATEGAQMAMAYGFGELELPEIVSFTAVNNIRSRNVMERLGMTMAKEFPHPKLPPDSELQNHLLYRKLAPVDIA